MKNRRRLTICILAFSLLLFSFSGVFAQAESEIAYLGGTPIGIGLAEKGLIVTGIVDVITDEGAVCPARGIEISTNDVITAINGEEIEDVKDFATKLQSSVGSVTLSIKRGESDRIVTLTPVTDSLTGLKKLGITVKNGINGIGTLTFVLSDGHFGALGHGILDADTGKIFKTDQGSVYHCVITGFRKPSKGAAGELVGRFSDRTRPIGKIVRCNEYGVYGIAEEGMKNSLIPIPLGSKSEVKLGKAYIFSTIDGDSPKKYEIEIVKAQSQNAPAEKSMLIKVTDETLLAATGGILQGMSGSPIVQNDRLIGAVTHVLLNDSTLGYGLYVDWMLRNAA
ncbi:MAG: SpoIVB peptidase [Clostridia bacterium]|nr:SpoIVB peptidase [Clostridia bacterium]